MKPRIFVSSTYYDLKYVRENLERFILNYNFEPVLFESGNVVFEHELNLDASCYNELKLCHMMILIIGGRYGSVASGENESLNVEKYESQYISVTRREYETALKKNIPVFIFIDKNVYSDYQTFSENKAVFESLLSKKGSEFKFAHVDNINIFRFIDFVRQRPIKTFEKFEEIEEYLRNQISGLFYLYLEQLQNKKEDEKILDTISELNNVTQRMNEMIKEVGRKVIDEEEFKKVTQKQVELLLDFFVQAVSDNIKIESNNDKDLSKEECDKIAKILFEGYLKDTTLKSYWDASKIDEYIAKVEFITKELNDKISEVNSKVKLKDINFYSTNYRYLKDVKPIIENDKTKKLEGLLLKLISKMIDDKTASLPF